MNHIEKFKKHFDFGLFKDINPDRIEVRTKNLEQAVGAAKDIIRINKLNLKVYEDAEMAAYKAFEIIALS